MTALLSLDSFPAACVAVSSFFLSLVLSFSSCAAFVQPVILGRFLSPSLGWVDAHECLLSWNTRVLCSTSTPRLAGHTPPVSTHTRTHAHTYITGYIAFFAASCSCW